MLRLFPSHKGLIMLTPLLLLSLFFLMC